MRALLLILLFLSPLVHALTESQTKDYQTLLEQTRCLTCLNQSLAESSTPVSKAMQDEILVRIERGETPEQIRAYLVEAYGEFVSFKPAKNRATFLLWTLPWVLIGVAMWWLARKVVRT